MATHISSALRQFVEERANNTCEYCLLNQLFSMYKHEIDHVIAVKHGGKTIGRTTVFLLRMNDSDRLKLRYSLIAQGVYPNLPR